MYDNEVLIPLIIKIQALIRRFLVRSRITGGRKNQRRSGTKTKDKMYSPVKPQATLKYENLVVRQII